VRPQWTHPSLSAEEIRRNGGVAPPVEPIIPDEFTIQLYNPDHQIVVTHKSGSLVGSPRWIFSMPQNPFRSPSGSLLDRSQNDPAASGTTSKINFKWKKESSLSKELTCYMTGKSTDVIPKKRNKEPDITVALLKSLKEITIYEPNLYRIETEDRKGLEVVLLLGAAAIRDIYFRPPKLVFNMSEPVRRASRDRRGSGGDPVLVQASAIPQPPPQPTTSLPSISTAAMVNVAPANNVHQQSLSKPQQNPTLQWQENMYMGSTPSPTTDANIQWKIDAETTRLKAEAEAEERDRRRVEEFRRRDRGRADELETRRLQKMVEAEAKEARHKQRQIETETQRLRKVYGDGPTAGPSRPSQSLSCPISQAPVPTRPRSAQSYHNQPPLPQLQWPREPQTQLMSNGTYIQTPSFNPHASTLSLLSGVPSASGQWRKKVRWDMQCGNNSRSRLSKKMSSVW